MRLSSQEWSGVRCSVVTSSETRVDWVTLGLNKNKHAKKGLIWSLFLQKVLGYKFAFFFLQKVIMILKRNLLKEYTGECRVKVLDYTYLPNIHKTNLEQSNTH